MHPRRRSWRVYIGELQRLQCSRLRHCPPQLQANRCRRLTEIVSFKVLDLSKYSDHKPCLCKIRTKNTILEAEDLINQLEDAPRKYKWVNEDDRLHYNFLAIQNLQSFSDRIQEISQRQCNTISEVVDLIDSLVRLYQEMADRLIGRPTEIRNKGAGVSVTKTVRKKR